MAETGSKLSEEKILEVLKSFNVPIRMNDLKAPTREFVIRVFECFLRDLQVDISSPKLRSWETISHMEETEMYEDTEVILLLAMSLNHITKPWGLDFTIKDIVEPKPKRTKKILNYIIVFWHYYLQKYARFHSKKEESETDRMRAQEVINEIESLDVKYNDLLVELKNMELNKEDLSSRVKINEEKGAELNAECTQLGNDYQSLKTKELDIKEQISEAGVNILKAKERLDELSQLILSSPDRINSEIHRLEDRIKNDDIKIKNWENKYKDLLKKLQLQETDEKNREEILNSLNETKKIIDNLRSTVQSIVAVHQEIGEKEDKGRQLEMDLERKEDWKLQLQQKLAKVVLNTKMQVERLQEAVSKIQSEEAKLRKRNKFLTDSNKKLLEDIDLKSDDILDIINKSKEAEAKSRERENQFISILNGTYNQFKSDCKEIVEMLQNTFPFNSRRNPSETEK